MDALVTINAAIVRALEGVTGIGTVFSEPATPIDPEQPAGYAVVELDSVRTDTALEGRTFRTMASSVMHHDTTTRVLLISPADSDAEVARFKAETLAQFAGGLTQDRELARLSRRFYVSDMRFYRVDNRGVPEVAARCQVGVRYRAKAGSPGTAIVNPQ